MTASQNGALVENDLKRPLEDAKKAIEDIEGILEETKEKLDVITE